MKLTLSTAGWTAPNYHYPYGATGTSKYFTIPHGRHIPQYETYSSYLYYCFSNPYFYDFQADRKYTIGYNSSGFYITDDGKIQ